MANPLELINSVKAVVDSINNNEKFAVPLLAKKAYKSAIDRPNDQTLRLMANVLGKMSEHGELFITRGKLRNIFKDFYSRNTKAREVFANELDIVDVNADRDIAGKESEEFGLYDSCADVGISNALSSLWDEKGLPSKSGKLNTHNPKLEKQAETLTLLELSRLGYSPKKVNTFGGSEEYIVCDAVYETPKGEAHILIPVEFSKSGAIIPCSIVSKAGLFDLNKDTLKQTILSSAGKSIYVDSNLLLKSLSSMNEIKDLSEFELQALIAQENVNNKKISKEASNYSVHPMYNGSSAICSYDICSDEGGEIKLAESKETKVFASHLNSGNGIAEFQFGKEIVNNGRNLILNKMGSFGYKPQISVSTVCDDSIIYAVGCDSRNGPVGFEVIVEVKNNKPMIPSILAVEDSVFEFTKEGVEKVISNQISDPKMVAVVSPYYGLKPSELINTIVEAANKNNYRLAEDALVVLSQTAGPEAYSKGLTEYMRSLEGINKTASVVKKGCSKVMKSSIYQEQMCGHLHLPLSKVAQNDKGECIPKYRESIDDTYDGIDFDTSKVFA